MLAEFKRDVRKYLRTGILAGGLGLVGLGFVEAGCRPSPPPPDQVKKSNTVNLNVRLNGSSERIAYLADSYKVYNNENLLIGTLLEPKDRLDNPQSYIGEGIYRINSDGSKYGPLRYAAFNSKDATVGGLESTVEGQIFRPAEPPKYEVDQKVDEGYFQGVLSVWYGDQTSAQELVRRDYLGVKPYNYGLRPDSATLVEAWEIVNSVRAEYPFETEESRVPVEFKLDWNGVRGNLAYLWQSWDVETSPLEEGR